VTPALRGALWLLGLATLLIALAVGAFAAWLLSDVLPPGTVITVDRERFVMPLFEHPGEWMMVVLLVLAVSLAIAIALPIVVVLAIVVPVFVGSLGAIGALLVIALIAWPVVALVRWLTRSRARRATMAPP
jgi:hypothetical protein